LAFVLSPHYNAIPTSGLGSQTLADLFECASDINSIDLIRKAALEAAKLGNITVVKEVTHEFAPHGISCVLVLAESHMALHTWPEYGYVSIDLFTCDSSIESEKIIQNLKSTLKADRVESRTFSRGVPPNLSH